MRGMAGNAAVQGRPPHEWQVSMCERAVKESKSSCAGNWRWSRSAVGSAPVEVVSNSLGGALAGAAQC